MEQGTMKHCPPPRPRRRPSGLPTLFALLLVTAASCLPGPVNLPGVGGDEYARELSRWTRKVEVYRRFEAKVFVTATYHSPSFRQAYVRKRIAILGLAPPDQRRMEQEQRQRQERWHEFFVAIYTGDRRWNDLDRGDKGLWRLTLQSETGQRVRPAEIVRVKKRNAEMVSFYPYLNAFRTGYLIRFPKRTEQDPPAALLQDESVPFTLHLSSPVAVAALTWEPPTPAKP